MTDARTERGFTLIELMVVVLIIGILVAIAVPVFQGAKQNAERRACASNERIAEGAYNTYISKEETVATLVTWNDLMGVLVPDQIIETPTCPAGGTYTWTANTVYCSVHGTYHH